KIVGNAELFYPLLKGERSVRISGFFDAGQIYVNGFTPEFENFRFSGGVGLAWNSPIGPLKFSYAVPINSIQADKIQKFQFQVGTVFSLNLEPVAPQEKNLKRTLHLIAVVIMFAAVGAAYGADYKIGFVNTERL